MYNFVTLLLVCSFLYDLLIYNLTHFVCFFPSAMWGTVQIAYVIRLRFDGEEIHSLQRGEMERELMSVDQELLQLRLAIRRGRELGRQMRSLAEAWRLAKLGRLVLEAHFARQEQLQRRQLQQESSDRRQTRRLAEARAQLKRLRDMAKTTYAGSVRSLTSTII